jgi:hypothetical protein
MEMLDLRGLTLIDCESVLDYERVLATNAYWLRARIDYERVLTTSATDGHRGSLNSIMIDRGLHALTIWDMERWPVVAIGKKNLI